MHNTAMLTTLTAHVVRSVCKQIDLKNHCVSDSAWTFEVFDWHSVLRHWPLHWHAQILGTESHETNTWLWAWANAASNLSPLLIHASLEMKRFGEEQAIPELTQPKLALSADNNGHVLSMIASGICNADAYYHGPYDGGAVFLLIKDDNFPRSTEYLLAHLPHAFPTKQSRLSQSLTIGSALTSYLDQCGILYRSEGNAVIVEEAGETVLTATFDNLKRLAKLTAAMSPPDGP